MSEAPAIFGPAPSTGRGSSRQSNGEHGNWNFIRGAVGSVGVEFLDLLLESRGLPTDGMIACAHKNPRELLAELRALWGAHLGEASMDPGYSPDTGADMSRPHRVLRRGSSKLPTFA